MSGIHVNVYTDGSYSTLKQGVGWGVVVENPQQNNEFIYRKNGVVTEPSLLKLNNVIGEIQAAIAAMQLAQALGVTMVIHYDYEGIESWVTGKWKAKHPAAKAYVQIARPLLNEGMIKFKKVLAHSGNQGNEEADRLAKMALDGVLV